MNTKRITKAQAADQAAVDAHLAKVFPNHPQVAKKVASKTAKQIASLVNEMSVAGGTVSSAMAKGDTVSASYWLKQQALAIVNLDQDHGIALPTLDWAKKLLG
jgi:hypothetical protein